MASGFIERLQPGEKALASGIRANEDAGHAAPGGIFSA